MTKEVVTIQVGSTANYVGSHFWNLQLEYLKTPAISREISIKSFLRENFNSRSNSSDTSKYSPRVQIIDTKKAFGALSTDAGSVLTEVSQEQEVGINSWDEDRQQIYVRDRILRSKLPSASTSQSVDNYGSRHHEELEHLDSNNTHPSLEPRYWSDYLDNDLHPRSCQPIPTIHANEDSLGFYSTGRDITTTSFCDELYNNLRYFVEECDSLGGICFLSDADTMFSGVTTSYLAHLDEELGLSLPKLVFGVHNPLRVCRKETAIRLGYQYNEKEELRQAQNEAQLVTDCLEHSSEYIPMSSAFLNDFDSIRVSQSDQYRTAAALSVGLNVALTPLQQDFSLRGLLGNIQPSPIALYGNIAFGLPNTSTKAIEADSIFNTQGVINLSQVWKIPPRHIINLKDRKKVASPLYSTTEVSSARGFSSAPSHYSLVVQPISAPPTFPQIFGYPSSHGAHNVHRNATVSSQFLNEKQTISAAAGLCTNNEDGSSALKALGTTLKKSKYSSLRYGEEVSDATEKSELLISRAEDYEDL